MSVTQTRTLVRPTVGTLFYNPSPDFKDLIQEYKSNNKIILHPDELSADGLTLTIITEYADQATYDAFQAEAATVSHRQNKESYNTSNNITETSTVA